MRLLPLLFLLLMPAVLAQPASAQTGCLSGSCVDGVGRFGLDDGTTYEGDFSDGLQHGQGLLTFPNGSSFSGSWHAGKKDGIGTYTLVPEGIVTVGRWQAGRREGVHIFIPSTGPIEYALFEGDALVRTLTEAEAGALSSEAEVRRGFGFSYMAHPGGPEVTLIVGVAPGGPAAQAGIRAGDHLVSVNGVSLHGLAQDAIAHRLTEAGSSPSSVPLGVFRPGTATRSGQDAVLDVRPGSYSVVALQQADAVARSRFANAAAPSPLATQSQPTPQPRPAPAPQPLSERIPVPRTAPGPDDRTEMHLAYLLHHARTAFVDLRGAPTAPPSDRVQKWESPYGFNGRRVVTPTVARFESEHYPWDHHTTFVSVDDPADTAEAVRLYRSMFDRVLTGWTYAETTEVDGSPSHRWSECAQPRQGRSVRLTTHTLSSGDHALVVKAILERGTLCRPNDF